MAEKHWAEVSPDSLQANLEAGLGASRQAEYELAPYGQIVQATIPELLWSSVFFSWLSMKGHLQGLHDMDRTQMFATRQEDRVFAQFITVWTNREAYAEWLQHGYPVEEMLRSMGIDEQDIVIIHVRDFS